EGGHPVEDRVDLRDHVLSVDGDHRVPGSAEGDMEDGPLLGDVDLLAPEHGVDAVPEAGVLGQLYQEPQRLVGDAVLRVVEVQAHRLDRHPLTPLRILGEKLAQMGAGHGRGMGLERLPGRGLLRGAHGFTSAPRLSSAALFEEITSIRSFQDFTNASAPCVWSLAPRVATLTPAAANRVRTS